MLVCEKMTIYSGELRLSKIMHGKDVQCNTTPFGNSFFSCVIFFLDNQVLERTARKSKDKMNLR